MMQVTTKPDRKAKYMSGACSYGGLSGSKQQFLVPTGAISIKETWFCGSKQKIQENNLTIKNIFMLFSVWFSEVPWKAKNVKNNKPAAILKLAFVPSIRTSSWNRAGLHSNTTAHVNN